MPAQQSIAVLVTFLHNLSTVVWIGGLIALGIAVLPSARKVLGAGSQIVTGLLMTNRSPDYEGFLAFPSLSV